MSHASVPVIPHVVPHWGITHRLLHHVAPELLLVAMLLLLVIILLLLLISTTTIAIVVAVAAVVSAAAPSAVGVVVAVCSAAAVSSAHVATAVVFSLEAGASDRAGHDCFVYIFHAAAHHILPCCVPHVACFWARTLGAVMAHVAAVGPAIVPPFETLDIAGWALIVRRNTLVERLSLWDWHGRHAVSRHCLGRIELLGGWRIWGGGWVVWSGRLDGPLGGG